jgi:hypothetical protein
MPRTSLECNKMVVDRAGKRTHAKRRRQSYGVDRVCEADFSILPAASRNRRATAVLRGCAPVMAKTKPFNIVNDVANG